MGVVLSHALAPPSSKVRMEFADLYGMRLLDLRPVAFTRGQEIIKRCFDIIASTAILFLVAPVMLVLAALIKLTSEGPVFYKSPRVGKGGRHFTFLKFRSMYQDKADRKQVAAFNEKGGHIFKIRNDPRVTPLGRFMRRYSLDELPQLFNVLRGEMSLVGPRPLPAADLDPDGQSRKFASWSEQRSRVLPGLTGLWQISGRSDLSFEKMIDLDVEYIRNWSLGLDLRILLETPLVALTGRGAY
jgi:exopolysaccharide biosynthesis polyprenyl glycosylphosphotransferase